MTALVAPNFELEYVNTSHLNITKKTKRKIKEKKAPKISYEECYAPDVKKCGVDVGTGLS